MSFLKLKLWPGKVQKKFTFTIYPITFPEENAREWKKLFKPCASQRLFLPVSQMLFFPATTTRSNFYFIVLKNILMVIFFVFPADPKGRGLFALCRYRYSVFEASRGHLGPAFSV